MKEQLKKILPENRIDEFFQLGKVKSIKASDFFIRATLAGILGFVLVKSMYETNGFFWPG